MRVSEERLAELVHQANCSAMYPGRPSRAELALDLRDARAALRLAVEAMEKAADTFRDMGRVARVLGRTAVAEACDIAETGTRETLGACRKVVEP